jgi:hypothetical protein
MNGTYTITPTLAGYVFTPASQPVTVSGSSQSGVNFTSAIGTYSVPDCRDYAQFPNTAVNVQGTLTYTGAPGTNVTDCRKAGAPVDSRKAGAPVDSRVAPNIPENSRTQPPFED